METTKFTIIMWLVAISTETSFATIVFNLLKKVKQSSVKFMEINFHQKVLARRVNSIEKVAIVVE